MRATTDRPRRRSCLPMAPACLTAVGLLLALAPSAAGAQDSSDVQQGAEVLGAVNNGERDCTDLGDTDFEAVGEFMMERMLGSTEAHGRMERMMGSAMGAGGRDRMHRFMGERLTGCGGGSVPGGYGGMMQMMGMMGGIGPGGGPGVGAGEDSRGSDAYGPGMMGPVASGGSDADDDWGAGLAVLMSLSMLALVGLIVFWLIGVRRRSPRAGFDSTSAIAILDRRLAAGELDRDDYQRRRAALAGPD